MAFFTGPEAVKAILHSRAAEFPKGALQNDVLRPLLGSAMITSEGEQWRWQRSATAPLFRHEEILRYGPVMTEAAEAAVERWRQDGGQAPRLIHRDMLRAAFDVISRTMLTAGAPELINAIERGHARYFQAVNWWITYRLLGLPRWMPRPGRRAMQSHEGNLRGDAFRAIVERDHATAGGGKDLLSRLACSTDPETGQAMPTELVADNIAAFLVAGYDTTALTLTWSLYLLSQSPEWSERIREEVIHVAGSGPVTSAHVASLPIVQQVVNESLRLYPTAPIIVRDIVEDTEIGGVIIRGGTIGFIPIYAIHRHRANWSDPDRFDPNRFAPDAAKPSRYKFLPFGAGPRICIGAAFAVIEATIMLATFLRAARFELVAGSDPRPSGRTFLRPQSELRMIVTTR
jgi:cytochrome P450